MTSRCLIPTQSKDRIPVLATPNVIYSFLCNTCNAQYIGRTERRLEDRVKEHLPKWVFQNADKVAKSSVTEHILHTGHPSDRKASFRILHKARDRRMLKYLEAVAIRLYKPSLNVQRDMDYQLKLPWT